MGEIWIGIAAIIGAFSTVVAARVGWPGRVMRLEYAQRRADLITKLLVNHGQHLDQDVRTSLYHELQVLASDIACSSEVGEREPYEFWLSKSWFYRLFVLPPQRQRLSFLGKVTTCLSYLYLIGGVVWVVDFFFPQIDLLLLPEDEQVLFVVQMLIGHLLLFLFLRSVSLALARPRARL